MIFCIFGLTSAADNSKNLQESKDRWLIYWYISGNNLERDGGHMTADMQEMINVKFLSNGKEDFAADEIQSEIPCFENPNKKNTAEEAQPIVKPHVVFPLGSQLSPNVKVLIQTGGCSVWFNNDIPNNTIGRYICDTSGTHFQGAFEDVNMGDAKTLESFLHYGKDKVEKEFKPTRRIFIFSMAGLRKFILTKDTKTPRLIKML